MITLPSMAIVVIFFLGFYASWYMFVYRERIKKDRERKKREAENKKIKQWAFEFANGDSWQTALAKDDLPVFVFYKAQNAVNLTDKTWIKSRLFLPSGSPVNEKDLNRLTAFPVFDKHTIYYKYNAVYRRRYDNGEITA